MYSTKGITGRRVLLRAITRNDLPILWSFINDRSAMRFSNVFRPITELQQEQWFRRISEDRNSSWFVIALRKSPSKVIGICCLENIDWISRSAEIRMRIGKPRYWGKGYGPEVMRLLIQHAFDDLNLTRLWGCVYAFNKRALRMDLSLGFKIEGRLREAAYIAGSVEDVIMVGLLKKEWR